MNTDNSGLLSALPEEMLPYAEGRRFVRESIGLSGDEVWMSENAVLKIGTDIKNSLETVKMLRWLAGRLPVPEVIAHTVEGGKSFLLMTRIKGRMSCEKYFLEHPAELLERMAEGLWMFWDTDITGCPRIRDAEAELDDLRPRLEKGLIGDPALFRRLENSKPPCDPVLSHGDFCLPNVFIDGGHISGFVDLGDSGIADRYRDIALCWQSLKSNSDGTFGGKVYPDFDPDALFSALGITPDREKLNYYLQLGELFG